jgi:putative AlgH/UPF0301 family transcriptional regulator
MGPARQCRICLDEEDVVASGLGAQAVVSVLAARRRSRAADPWVAPCGCSGTQRWVHVRCLREWQAVCTRNRRRAKAVLCTVCGRPYSLAPHTESAPARAAAWVRSLWPSALIGPALFLLQVALALALFFAVTVCAKTLSVRGRGRPALADSPSNGGSHRDGSRGASPRQGGAVAPTLALPPAPAGASAAASAAALCELRAGTLLVASPAQASGPTANAVLLLLEAPQRSGGRAVVLNRPLAPYERRQLCRRGLVVAASPRSLVGHGGPSSQHQVTVLHDVRGCPGSVELCGDSGLFVLQPVPSAELELGAAPGRCKVLFGAVEFAQGQLEREVLAGLWLVDSRSTGEGLRTAVLSRA